ncbi:hypothetical protein OH77DRAFT_1405316 [Trametes cingulata]|nr:hypothetical protein OH77DRAFT_1405316 [Trametes cingulata]
MAGDDHGAKKKKERTNESFIVVRPPPSKTNHPLNLQVQLVPPSNRDVNRSSSGRRSRDSSVGPADDDGASDVQLTRTSSNRSDVSMYSSYSSTSISSMASTSTTSSGRRMIIPLYNLQAHNVLTNVIVDAGTDAKVAKFQKRGLEVIGLAVLEPVEVWGEGGNPAPIPGNSPNAPLASLPDEHAPRASVDLAQSHLTPEPPHTPTSSALSLNSEGTSEHPHTPAPVTPTPTSATPVTPRNTPGAKKFFGKFFKRRSDSPSTSPSFPTSPLPPINAQPPSPAQPTTPIPSASGEHSRVSRRSSLHLGNTLSIPGHTPSASGSDAHPPSARENVVLQPPVLGIQPTLSSLTNPPRGRPTKYVWVVRRWLKGSPESLLSGMKGKFNEARGAAAQAGAVESQVEVRFEWTRGKSGKKRRSRRDTADSGVERTHSQRHSLALSSAAQSQTSLHQQPPQVVVSDPPASKKRVASASAAEKPARPRRSVDSHRSTSPHATASTTTANSDEDQQKVSPSTEDHDDESDPEDSETPWTCTLIVRRLNASRLPQPGSPLPTASAQASGPGSSTVRVKVAGVVPTPHHPKVVALLKVPFPLPDVEIERMQVRKRIITPAGVARPATSSGDRPTNGNGNGNGNAAGSIASSNGRNGGSGMKSFFGGAKENHGPGAGAGANPEGLILTAEEIKDIVSSTGLWLVVREGFGGVGRVSRKGDGWRLRG